MAREADLYRVLQIDPEAEPEVVRAAFVCLAKKYHPDGGSGAPERMVELNEAWAVLGDPAKRAEYDLTRTAPTRSAPATSPASPPASPAAPSPAWSAGSPARSGQGESETVYTPPPSTRFDGTGSGSTTLDFGRYAGWTLAALVRADPDYVEWLARAPVGMKYRTEIYALLKAREQAAGAGAARERGRAASAVASGGGWAPPWRSRGWRDR